MLNWTDMDDAARGATLARPIAPADGGVARQVADIFTAVERGGDATLRELTSKFDGCTLKDLLYAPSLDTAQLDNNARKAIETAMRNIRAFHQRQKPQDYEVEVQSGVICQRRYVPMQRVGLYIPGGTAPLFSTLLMLVIPAQIAGVGEILLASPPRENGRVDPVIEDVAAMLGVKTIMPVGGAQAIAAMAMGTETIRPVDKIFGPGNIWVTEAKKYASALTGGPAIDMPAGPSEVLVIADGDANAEFVASDLLSQAEHDPLAQSILLSTSIDLIKAVTAALDRQVRALSRSDILARSRGNIRMILCANLDEAMAISNAYAPEHLIINTANCRDLLLGVCNAGSVFLGPWSTESAGDYASGTNHVLPTAGAARAYSGLGVDAFMKSITVQELSADGLKTLGPVVSELARMEGLDGHAASVDLRLSKLKGAAS